MRFAFLHTCYLDGPLAVPPLGAFERDRIDTRTAFQHADSAFILPFSTLLSGTASCTRCDSSKSTPPAHEGGPNTVYNVASWPQTGRTRRAGSTTAHRVHGRKGCVRFLWLTLAAALFVHHRLQVNPVDSALCGVEGVKQVSGYFNIQV